MKGKQRILAPMDDRIRRQGIVLGSVGIILLFASAVAMIFTPADLLAWLIIPLAVGLALIVAGYYQLRRAEMILLERELPSRRSK